MVQGRWDSARNQIQGVLSRDPRNTNALLALGMLEEGTGHNDAAIQAYRKIVEIDSSNPIAKKSGRPLDG